MRRGLAAAFLLLLLLARTAAAQTASVRGGTQAGWQSRSYPELRTIMQAGYSESDAGSIPVVPPKIGDASTPGNDWSPRASSVPPAELPSPRRVSPAGGITGFSEPIQAPPAFLAPEASRPLTPSSPTQLPEIRSLPNSLQDHPATGNAISPSQPEMLIVPRGQMLPDQGPSTEIPKLPPVYQQASGGAIANEAVPAPPVEAAAPRVSRPISDFGEPRLPEIPSRPPVQFSPPAAVPIDVTSGLRPDVVFNPDEQARSEPPAAPPPPPVDSPAQTAPPLDFSLGRHCDHGFCAATGCDGVTCDGMTCDGLFQDPRCPLPNPCGRFLPFANLGIKPGNHRTIGMAELFFPIRQDSDSLLFGDFNGQWDDQSAGAGYFGLGYRTFLDDNCIFGTYLYYDLLASSQGNYFSQGNVGLELMSLNWTLRFNGYFPGGNGQSAPDASGYSNGTIVTQNFIERAYPGFDWEIGQRFLYWGWNDRYQLHWFLGSYSFTGGDAYPTIQGPMGRLEMRIFDLDWLGQQSRVELGMEVSHDSVRNDQIFGYLRVRIPFGAKSRRDVLDPLRRRMVDTPVRVID